MFGDLAHQVGTEVGITRCWKHEDCFDIRLKTPIHQRHLKLVFIVGHGTYPTDDHVGILLARVLGEQTAEYVDLHVIDCSRYALADQVESFPIREHRFLLGIDQYRDNDVVERLSLSLRLRLIESQCTVSLRVRPYAIQAAYRIGQLGGSQMLQNKDTVRGEARTGPELFEILTI